MVREPSLPGCSSRSGRRPASLSPTFQEGKGEFSGSRSFSRLCESVGYSKEKREGVPGASSAANGAVQGCCKAKGAVNGDKGSDRKSALQNQESPSDHSSGEIGLR
ncbi:hypothetical protein FRB95_013219 [Tulasnella sp. JGI-2019a]|nr:hypothetical protein FRB95_013219 [Tulasnella sp. JGI-2019a]